MTKRSDSQAADRADASGSAVDLEAAAKAALVKGSATSEKTTEERLQDAKAKVATDTAAPKP